MFRTVVARSLRTRRGPTAAIHAAWVPTTTTAATATPTATTFTAAALVCGERSLFTNKKAAPPPGTAVSDDEVDPPVNKKLFFHGTVRDPSDIPAAHTAESLLPTRQQLSRELPTGVELGRAMNEGRLGDFASEEPVPDDEN